MPTTETAELYFIAGAFVLILIICAAAVYIFFRQLKREKKNLQEGTTSLEDQKAKKEAQKEDE